MPETNKTKVCRTLLNLAPTVYDKIARCADMLTNIDLESMTKAERNIAYELGMLDLLNFNKEKNVWERA
jgi:hypothetical protein